MTHEQIPQTASQDQLRELHSGIERLVFDGTVPFDVEPATLLGHIDDLPEFNVQPYFVSPIVEGGTILGIAPEAARELTITDQHQIQLIYSQPCYVRSALDAAHAVFQKGNVAISIGSRGVLDVHDMYEVEIGQLYPGDDETGQGAIAVYGGSVSRQVEDGEQASERRLDTPFLRDDTGGVTVDEMLGMFNPDSSRAMGMELGFGGGEISDNQAQALSELIRAMTDNPGVFGTGH